MYRVFGPQSRGFDSGSATGSQETTR